MECLRKKVFIYIYNDSIDFELKRGNWKYYNRSGKFVGVKKYPSVEKTLDSFYSLDSFYQSVEKETPHPGKYIH